MHNPKPNAPPQRPSTSSSVAAVSAVAPPKTGISCLLAAALACLVLLPLLGHRSLAMWDEGIYAEVSREMLHRSPLVPLWNYQPWFEKPPLMLWITAALFRVFGLAEFWVRAAAALSGVATVVLLHRFLARRFTLAAAWIGTVVLLSSFGFLHVCRTGEMDAPLALFEFAAILGLVRVHERDPRGWWIFWTGFAAALMTKGAASIVLPITALLAGVLDRWRWRDLRASFVAGSGLFLLLVLPWHIAMLHRFGPAFTHQYLGLHVLARASSQIEGHHSYPWYYIIVLLASAPPWVLLYPSAVNRALRRPELRGLRILAVFAIVVFVLFTVVRTRLPHYIAPVYPALSLLTAVWLEPRLRALNFRQLELSTQIGLVTLALTLWGAAAFATARTRSTLHSPRLANGAVTPDTHEPAALLKQALHSPTFAAEGPLLLWAEPPIAPITTALFYSRRAVVQVETAPAPSAPAPDIYTWNPQPLDSALTTQPRLLLASRSLLDQLPPSLSFTPLAGSAHWELGTISRSPPGAPGTSAPRSNTDLSPAP